MNPTLLPSYDPERSPGTDAKFINRRGLGYDIAYLVSDPTSKVKFKGYLCVQAHQVWDCGVRGEVWLWGTVVEHEQGWRAEFAYPKALCLPPDAFPVALGEIESRLHSLTGYRCDISILHGGASIPLWRKESGLDAGGLDFLTDRGKEWYTRCKRERTLQAGDRVAILGEGIAVVEHADGARVLAVLGKRERLRLLRRDIAWSDINSRWEASVSA
jgi:hypothetical protein